MQHLLYKIVDEQSLEDALAKTRDAAASCHPRSILLHFYCGNIFDRGQSSRDAFLIRMLERAGVLLPGAQAIGMSSDGEICRSRMEQPCILMSAFLFKDSWVKVLSFQSILSKEKEAGEALFEEVSRYEDVQGVELLFAGRGIDSVPIYESLRRCTDRLPFFGGYAIERDAKREPAYLLTDAGVLHDSMAAVIYGGESLHIDAGRTTGWKPLGNAFQVTGAKGRRLFSINGMPAYDLYNRFLRFPEEGLFRDYAMEFPLMVKRGKMQLLRHPLEKYDDSSVLLDGKVSEGDEIYLSYGAPLEIIRRMNMRCEKIRAFEPEALLLYSCPGRRSYWGDLVGWEMEPFQKVAETGGACLDGQIMRNNQTGRVLEHRLTLLSVAMREGGKTGRSIPEIAVDDEVLKSKMSLVHRMSTLIESTMEELQKANEALISMNERLARANEELHRVAITDELTGLYNRREIERRIKAALEKAEADNRSITLLMLDIDFFKKVNDTYGHDAGDIVLKDVSSILGEYVDAASGESAGRWGGEEFFVLLPDKGLKEAVALAERIRAAVEQHDFQAPHHLTVSIGVTNAAADSNYQAIFIQADRALYQAKQGGRNQVVSIPNASV